MPSPQPVKPPGQPPLPAESPESPEAPGSAVLAGLDALVDVLAATDLTQVPVAVLGAEIRAVARTVGRLEAQLSRRLEVFDARGGAASDREAGAASTKGWLQARLRMSGGEASRRVGIARALRALPVTAEAFGSGVVSAEQARVITAAMSGVDADTVTRADPLLADAARHLDPPRLRYAARGQRHAS